MTIVGIVPPPVAFCEHSWMELPQSDTHGCEKCYYLINGYDLLHVKGNDLKVAKLPRIGLLLV